MRFASVKSLRAKLALRLAALYIAATAIAIGILIYQAYDTAESLNDRELSLRAADLARYVVAGCDGKAHLELPPALASSYQVPAIPTFSRFAAARILSSRHLHRGSAKSRQSGLWGLTTPVFSISRILVPMGASTTV
jgi:hypothetical protein